MSMEKLIDAESQKYISERFAKELKDNVTIDVFTSRLQPNEYADFSLKFINELKALANGKLIVNELSPVGEEAKERNIDSTSGLTIHIGWDKGYLIEYLGAPAGYEASGFIDTIILIGQGNSGLSKASKEMLKYVSNPVTVYCFVTPSCPYCPQQVLIGNRIAIEAKGNVKAICVEAEENMILSQKWKVKSVPQQVINEDADSVTIGVQPENNFVDQVLKYGTDEVTYKRAVSEQQELLNKSTELVDNPDYPVTLTDSNFAQAVSKYPLLIVDCWADWCAPCKMIAPVVEELAGDYAGKIVFGKLDTDHNPDTSNKYRIRSIPDLLVFKNGELVDQIVGAMPKAQLEEKIIKFLD